MKITHKYRTAAILLISIFFVGWGSTGHKLININATLSFPSQMNEFLYWSDILASHASDADNRKSSDPTEDTKHFIDIDSYPEFISTGSISQNYDSVVALHGSTFVINEGILPWAIITSYDTLKNCFIRRDWNKAALVAADLGHYVADSHQPLHLTKNYNPNGLHSRYETQMINTYQNQIQIKGNDAQYISNLSDFVFSYIYQNYKYVDSLIAADAFAKAFAGDTRSTAYYQKLWELTGNFTNSLFNNASYRLASIIYTAWTDAGSPLPSGGVLPVELASFNSNVENQTVTLHWETASEQNNSGFEIQRSNDGNIFTTIAFIKGKGNSTIINQYSFSDKELNSGTYYYRLKQKDYNGSYKLSSITEAKVQQLPDGFNLSQNYPNPFNPSTTIKYQIPKSGLVQLKVYDALGREVSTLINEYQTAGEHMVLYNTQQTANNEQLSSGIYFYKLKAGNNINTKKFILLK